jgi:hypothetical protein
VIVVRADPREIVPGSAVYAALTQAVATACGVTQDTVFLEVIATARRRGSCMNFFVFLS